jgi:hypothetical protein
MRIGLGGLCLILVVALVGCGSGDRLHANTTFPVASDAKKVAETESTGDFGPQYDRYLVVAGNRGVTAKQLVNQEAPLARHLGWRRHTKCDQSACWGYPPNDYVSYEPADRLMAQNRMAKGVAKLVRSTPGPVRRKLVVEIAPPEPQQ